MNPPILSAAFTPQTHNFSDFDEGIENSRFAEPLASETRTLFTPYFNRRFLQKAMALHPESSASALRPRTQYSVLNPISPSALAISALRTPHSALRTPHSALPIPHSPFPIPAEIFQTGLDKEFRLAIISLRDGAAR